MATTLNLQPTNLNYTKTAINSLITIMKRNISRVAHDSSVDIATRYGLDGPGIELW